MKAKKFQWFFIIFIIVLFAILLCLFMPKTVNFVDNFIEKNEKNNFIVDVKSINKLASSYFLRNLDPKINKSKPNEGYVDIGILTENENAYRNFKGKVKIVIVNNNTNYYVNVSNEKFSYSGNINDLSLENIKEK